MKVEISRLDVNVEKKSFSTEASDLGGVPQELTIVSSYGTERTFTRTQVVRDDEGDVMNWLYEPTAETLANVPAAKGWYIIVFND